MRNLKKSGGLTRGRGMAEAQRFCSIGNIDDTEDIEQND